MEGRRLRRRYHPCRYGPRVLLRPVRSNGPPDPTIIQTAPKPDVAFLRVYAILAFLPLGLETPLMLVAPVIGVAAMLLVLVFASQGERQWSRRPVAVLSVSVIAVVVGVFTRLGAKEPWSPVMNAWTADAVPPRYLRTRTPLQRQGALVVQNKQCRNCHTLDHIGGQRGPALDAVATRKTEDQLIRQILQGGGTCQHVATLSVLGDEGPCQLSYHAARQP